MAFTAFRTIEFAYYHTQIISELIYILHCFL